MKRKALLATGLLLPLGLAILAAIAIVSPRELFPSRLDRLVRQLQTAKDPEKRASAAKALGMMGARARPAAPALVKALRDDGRYLTLGFVIIPQENYVNNEVFSALTSIRGQETAEAAVTEMLATSQRVKRGEAEWHWSFDSRPARLLAALGPEAQPVAERLLEAIDGCNQGEVVKWSVEALLAMKVAPGTPAAAKARQVLPQFFGWPDTGRKAAMLLHQIAPDDQESLAAYVSAMVSGEPPVGPGAVEVNARTLPLLIQHLADPQNQGVITQLGAGELSRVLMPLRAALRDPQARIRAGAAKALGNFETEASDAAPDLSPLLIDDNANVRVEAAIALWRIARRAEDTLPILASALTSEDPRVRDLAGAFLQQRGPKDSWATQHLAKIASHGEDKSQCLAATDILERLGPAASEALPVLLQLLKNEDPDVQRAAAKAVTAIEKR